MQMGKWSAWVSKTALYLNIYVLILHKDWHGEQLHYSNIFTKYLTPLETGL